MIHVWCIRMPYMFAVVFTLPHMYGVTACVCNVQGTYVAHARCTSMGITSYYCGHKIFRGYHVGLLRFH